MKKQLLVISALSLTLSSGCISNEQARGERDNHEMTECRRLGYSPYSESFADCRLQLRLIEAQEEQAKALRRNKSYHRHFAPLTEDYYKRCKVTHAGNTICKNW